VRGSFWAATRANRYGAPRGLARKGVRRDALGKTGGGTLVLPFLSLADLGLLLVRAVIVPMHGATGVTFRVLADYKAVVAFVPALTDLMLALAVRLAGQLGGTELRMAREEVRKDMKNVHGTDGTEGS
jgi:hypothetical protein